MSIDGHTIGVGSGMAPGAKIAMYKVCWTGEAPIPDGCFNSDSVAAINDAVADGVDVINYSIGGTSESDVLDSVDRPSAERRTPACSSPTRPATAAPAPARSTIRRRGSPRSAAATFRRAFQAVELGNGDRYVGASTTSPLPTLKPIVTAASVKLAAAAGARCESLLRRHARPGEDAGKIVVCDRGVNARHRQELRGQARRRRGHGPRQRRAELAQRRLPRCSLDPHHRRRRRRRQGVHRLGRRQRDGEDRAAHRGRARRRPAGPRDHRFLVTRSVDDDRRRHPQAGHRGSGQRRDRGGRPAEQPRPDAGTSCRGRRCPRRTSPASACC